MEDIKHTYTIQWVGPLTYDEYKEYVKGTDTIAPSYFNFYSQSVASFASSDLSIIWFLGYVTLNNVLS